MKARELLATLQGMTPEELELPVRIEGCDCDGPASEAHVDVPGGCVYITRGFTKENE
jgi:hypothetical protein